jgi:site-specific DNA recombinase
MASAGWTKPITTCCDGSKLSRRTSMKAAIYARVSTLRQAQAQTIEQQVSRLRTYVQQQGWSLDEAHIFRDDGYRGASLNRPGLDDGRDRASMADFEVIVMPAPDR